METMTLLPNELRGEGGREAGRDECREVGRGEGTKGNREAEWRKAERE